tara:strand:+ start:110 stop:316 length:207 start_codon:yes stop_codon:yes gene_type:complete
MGILSEEVMKEKSLKQREQLEGYLRDNTSYKLGHHKSEEFVGYETVDNFQKIFSNDNKGSLIVDRHKV